MPTTPSRNEFVKEVETSAVGDTVENPPAGSLALFPNQNDVWYAKTSAGGVSALSGLTSVTGDVTGSGSPAFAATVGKLQNVAVASTTPLVGQKLSKQSAGWTPTFERFNVADFGADGTGNGDVTVPIYNAVISSLITRTAASQTTVTAQQTATGTFTLSVAANSLAASGTLLVQTTAGTIKMGYTGGGGSTTLTGCTVSAGTSGGLILNGSIIGTQANTSGALYPQGGEIYFPNGAYIVSQPLIIPCHGIRLVAATPSQDSDVGSIVSTGSAIIYWAGAVGLPVISYCPTWSGQSAIQGAYVENLFIDCAGVAGIGIQFISCHQWKRINCTVLQPILAAYDFNTVIASWLGGAEAADCTRGLSINSVARCIDGTTGTTTLTTASTAVLNTFTGSQSLALSGTPSSWPSTNGVIIVQAVNQVTGAVMNYLMTYGGGGGTSTLTNVTALPMYANNPEETSTSNFVPTAKLFSGALVRQAVPGNAMIQQMSGSTTANACCSTFIGDTGKYLNGANWIGNSDNNLYINNVYNRTAGGGGAGWDVQGSTIAGASGASGSARNNHWISGSAGAGGITLRGTDSFSYLQRATANRWDAMEVSNGEPRPVIGSGCEFPYTMNGALTPAMDFSVSAATGNAATVGGAGTATTGQVPNMFIKLPPQGLAIGTSFKFRVLLSKGAAGTAMQLGLKFGANNTAADTTVNTGTSWTGTAVAETICVDIVATVTAVGSGTSASITAVMTPSGRSLGPAAITGWITTAVAYGNQNWAPTGFDSTIINPGPAYLGLYVLANTGTVVTALAGSAVEVIAA